jgi:ribosomal protein S13|tara:strand:+ start:817 stop:1125 length:309 start_codon:yes stop_codon:yes gene_type:complete
MLTSEDIKRINRERGPLDLTKQIDDLKKKVREAEGELSIIKGIGNNSPEMRALQEKVKEAGRINKLHQELIEELKAELARAKEEHQYDNLVHEQELRKALQK